MSSFSEWRSSFVALKYLPRFLGKVYHTKPSLFLSNSMLRLLSALLPIALLWVGKEIIDEVITLAGQEDPTLRRLFMLIGLELGLALTTDIFSRLISLTDGLLGDLYANSSSVELIQKTAKVELAYLEDSEFYDKLERARRQTVGRVSLMSNALGQVQDILTVSSLIAAIIYFYPILILLLVLSIIPSFINELKYSRSSYSLQKSWTPERRELDYMRVIGASDVTAKEVKLFGLADFISETFARVSDRYYRANRALTIKRTAWGAGFHIVGDLAYYGAYVFIVLKAVAALVTIGELTFLAGSFASLRRQLQGIFSRFSAITENALYLQDYFDFIDMEFNEDLGFEPLPLPEKITEGITFSNVTFRYAGMEKDVLKDVDFFLPVKQKIALVGENGAGKTTLVKLLLRLYEPTAGAILLDGVDVRHYPKAEYQQLFGAIFQDFVKYYLTARINIAVGNIDELDNESLVTQSAERSLADEVISTLPDGYDQELGRRFKKGAELSGGQWQKIALARAYMSESQVVILDEPTSALDARAEYEVFQRFLALTEDHTSVIISHRFSTVRMADRIIVLQAGTIAEDGTHQELVTAGGLYSELFGMQAAGYKD